MIQRLNDRVLSDRSTILAEVDMRSQKSEKSLFVKSPHCMGNDLEMTESGIYPHTNLYPNGKSKC